jgi:hypothetical protein
MPEGMHAPPLELELVAVLVPLLVLVLPPLPLWCEPLPPQLASASPTISPSRGWVLKVRIDRG